LVRISIGRKRAHNIQCIFIVRVVLLHEVRSNVAQNDITTEWLAQSATAAKPIHHSRVKLLSVRAGWTNANQITKSCDWPSSVDWNKHFNIFSPYLVLTDPIRTDVCHRLMNEMDVAMLANWLPIQFENLDNYDLIVIGESRGLELTTKCEFFVTHVG